MTLARRSRAESEGELQFDVGKTRRRSGDRFSPVASVIPKWRDDNTEGYKIGTYLKGVTKLCQNAKDAITRADVSSNAADNRIV